MPEKQPFYTPVGGVGSLSPKGEWKFMGGTTWVKNASSSTPSNVKEETPAGTLPSLGSNIGNLTKALRLALDEASQNTARSRMEALSGLVGGGAAPSVINAAIGLAQSGLRQRQQDIFSDTLQIFENERKRIELNPEQFRNVQGGIYDLKNNKWIIGPKEETGTTGGSLSLSDVKKLKLPVALVGTTWHMFQMQVNSPVAPSWFKNMVEQEKKQTLLLEELSQLWDQFRETFILTYKGDEISFEDI